MKKIFLFACILSGLIACDSEVTYDCGCAPPSPIFLKSYIQAFIDGYKGREVYVDVRCGYEIDTVRKSIDRCWRVDSSVIYDVKDVIGIEIESHLNDPEYNGEFYNVNLYRDASKNPRDMERQKGYDKYIELVGDTSFNREMDGKPDVVSMITPLKNIAITCDKDFGANYPAGSNLNELFTVYFDDPYSTVKNGYHPVEGTYAYFRGADFQRDNPQSIVKVRLSEANFSERPFIGNKWLCILDVAPERTDTYIFEVKITFVDGAELKMVNDVYDAVNIKGSKD
ncbi:MAG: hypothetical protein LBK47_03145 [Prevotellaceae bacterium]|nr:hypothetical protein [Prevotellaceae bacterium]